MQRRRGPAQTQRTREVTLPSTPAVQVTHFPKGRDRVTTDAELPAAVGDFDTDPLGDRARQALAADRKASEGAARRVEHRGPDRDALTYHRQKLDLLLVGNRQVLAGASRRERMEIASLGHGLYEQGRLQEARVVFEGLVALEPSEAFPYTVLGAIYLAQDDLQRALALFEAALGIDPVDPAALCYRGEIRLRLGQRARGLTDLRRAIEVDTPGSPFADRARATLEAEPGPLRRERPE